MLNVLEDIEQVLLGHAFRDITDQHAIQVRSVSNQDEVDLLRQLRMELHDAAPKC